MNCKLFHNETAHWEFLTKQAGVATVARISSFGLYAGISSGGYETSFPNYAKDFLNAFKPEAEVKIIVGLPTFFACAPDCEDCELKWNKSMHRILYTVEHWPRFKWKIVWDNHQKLYLLDQPKADVVVSGGRNLTASSWTDLSFTLPEAAFPLLSKRFDADFKKAKKATHGNIEKGSGRTLQKLY